MDNTKLKLELKMPFFMAWIFTFVFLYALSYLWHGVILNDLSRISYPKNFFLILVAAVYFCISFALTFLAQVLPFDQKLHIKGLIVGAPVGLFIYLIAFVFGISFYSNPTLAHILFDLGWQVFEGAIGGIIAGGLLSFFGFIASERKKSKASN